MEHTAKASDVVWSEGLVSRADRSKRLNLRGATVWLTGLPASGKSTIGAALERTLVESGVLAYRVDGDNLRHGLNANLGFSESDRAENVRRAGEACLLLADAGAIAIACFVSPYAKDRDRVRARHAAAGVPWFEVFVDVPVAVAEARDPKGHYRKARSGELAGFTGVSAPYEPPACPELRLAASEAPVEQSVKQVITLLRTAGILS